MLHSIPSEYPENDHKKRQEAIRKAMKSAMKQEPTEILKSTTNQGEAEHDPEKQKLLEMSRMLFHEGLGQYETGKLKFDEFADDLHRSMLAVGKSKEKAD